MREVSLSLLLHRHILRSLERSAARGGIDTELRDPFEDGCLVGNDWNLGDYEICLRRTPLGFCFGMSDGWTRNIHRQHSLAEWRKNAARIYSIKECASIN